MKLIYPNEQSRFFLLWICTKFTDCVCVVVFLLVCAYWDSWWRFILTVSNVVNWKKNYVDMLALSWLFNRLAVISNVHLHSEYWILCIYSLNKAFHLLQIVVFLKMRSFFTSFGPLNQTQMVHQKSPLVVDFSF